MTSSNPNNKFPIKLFQILQEAETTPYLAEIVSWLPDGKSFKVHQKEKFSRSILPATFGTNVYKSFQRNLHFWGYHNIRKGPSKGVCSHPCFLRDRPDLLSKMRRVRAPSKANGSENQHDSVASLLAEQQQDAQESNTGKIPAFVFAADGSQRVVSPSMTSSSQSSHSKFQGLTDHSHISLPNLSSRNSSGSMDPLPALLLLLQQNQQGSKAAEEDKKEQQQSVTSLAEALLVRQILEQQQQKQEQQRRIQDLLASLATGQQQQQPSSNQTLDQNALAGLLLSQLLLQQGSASNNVSSNNNNSNHALLRSLLGM